jgi:hypothetical protein
LAGETPVQAKQLCGVVFRTRGLAAESMREELVPASIRKFLKVPMSRLLCSYFFFPSETDETIIGRIEKREENNAMNPKE